MRPARLAVLAVMVLAMGAFIYFYERKQPTTDEVKEREGKIFADFDQAKARRVVVTNAKGRFELKKENDTWQLVSPLVDDANSGSVTSLLSSLANLKSERALDVKEVKLAEYGLGKPAVEVLLEVEGGKQYTLKVGRELSIGNNRPVMATSDKIHMVTKSIASDIDRDLAGWRSDQLTQVYSGDVAAVNLTLEGKKLVLAHTGNAWSLTEPVADLANREKADGLISDIAGARIKEFVDAPGDLAPLGLASPRIMVTILRRGEKAAPIQLAFGNEREVDNAKQVACKRGERVLWVEAKAIEKASADLAGWRAAKLVALDSWSVDKLAIEVGSNKVALERKDGLWKNGSVEVDSEAVNERLTTLTDLDVKGFDRPKPTSAALGVIKATTNDKTSVEVTFYPGGSDAEALATVAGRSGALEVDGAKVKSMLADTVALGKPRPTPTPTPKTTPTEKPATAVTPAASPEKM